MVFDRVCRLWYRGETSAGLKSLMHRNAGRQQCYMNKRKAAALDRLRSRNRALFRRAISGIWRHGGSARDAVLFGQALEGCMWLRNAMSPSHWSTDETQTHRIRAPQPLLQLPALPFSEARVARPNCRPPEQCRASTTLRFIVDSNRAQGG
jgi:hypothetical protein